MYIDELILFPKKVENLPTFVLPDFRKSMINLIGFKEMISDNNFETNPGQLFIQNSHLNKILPY